MQQSLMPKGVEHNQSFTFLLPDELVQQSLMPKGVEHLTPSIVRRNSRIVQQSLMPKGVEHDLRVLGAGQDLGCSNL